jgi:ankyrin repeat protein
MKKSLLVLIVALMSNLIFSQETLNVFDIARKGTVEQAKEKFKDNPNSFNVLNDEGYSPLLLACYRSNNEVAKYLINIGSDINGKSKFGTPLMACIVKGNNEIATFLIQSKADINAADSNGTTALIYAVQFKNTTILKLLLENKVDKSHKDKSDKTAFEHAVFSRNEEIINLLK